MFCDALRANSEFSFRFTSIQKPLPLTLRSWADDSDDIPADINLLRVPYLPVSHVLADGTRIVIRHLRDRDEIRSYYDALQAAIASGAGYGLDELPNIGFFVRWYVSNFYNLVYELSATSSGKTAENAASTAVGDAEDATSCGGSGRVIAYANFGPSLFSRTVNNSVLSDGNFVMLPEFRGRGWAAEMHEAQFGISYDVGLKRVFGETSTKNLPSMLTMRRAGVIITGSIPRGIYFKDAGWTDLVTMYRVLEESESYEGKRKGSGGQRHGLRIASKI